jgi:cation transport ATPase
MATEAIRRQAGQLGLGLLPADRRGRPTTGQRPWWRRAPLLALAAASALLLAGLAAEHLAGQDTLARGLYLATVAVGGLYPVRGAVRLLGARRLTIGTLLVLAAAGALALGVFEEAALLVVVFSLGEVLEDYAADRARGAIRALLDLAPPQAQRRSPDGTLQPVPVEDLVPGEVVVVRPGERLPTDGRVTSGSSAVDQGPITASRCPSRSHRARSCSAAPSTAPAPWRSRSPSTTRTPPWPGSSARSSRPRPTGAGRSGSPTASAPSTPP